MSKDAYYFKHDYNARGDEKIMAMVQAMGWEGYGLYWALVEMMYEAEGSLRLDYDRLSFGLHSSPDKLKQVVSNFGLFYFPGGGKKLASRSVDRRLSERREKQMQASEAGKASAEARKSQRQFNVRSTSVQPGEGEGEGERERDVYKEPTERIAAKSPIPNCAYNDRGQGYCSQPSVKSSRYCVGHKLKVAEKFHEKNTSGQALPSLKSFQ